MSKKGLDSILKVSICILIVMGLLVAVSCKQSEDEAPPAGQEKEAAKEPEKNTPEPPKVVKKDTPTTKETEPVKQPVSDEKETPKWVPIPIKLPKPMFVGTPQDTKVANLEKPTGKPRPDFYAPPDVKNVAFEKPVTSTDEEPIIGDIEMITDGDKEAADGSYVELGPFQQHVTVDLEAEYNIYAIVAWHYHKQARVYFDVVVQVANDPDFVDNVITLYNNDIDNSAGLGVGKDKHYTETSEGRLIAGKGVKARYVRLYSHGNNSNDLNHYIEVEVFGKPAG